VLRGLALVAAGIALSIAASYTTAFSTGADVVTAAAIGVFVAAGIGAAFHRRPAAHAARLAARTSPQGDEIGAPPGGPLRAGFVLWAVTGGIALAFELGNYFVTPRTAHPTVSYFLAGAAGEPWSRGVLFACWLALGGYLVRR